MESSVAFLPLKPEKLTNDHLNLDSISEATSVFIEPVLRTRKETVALFSEPVEYSWVNINVFSGPCIQNADGSLSMIEKAKESRKPNIFSKLFLKQHKPRQILRHATGIAHSGEILALMGSSGAGKTTLMNILMYRTSLKLKISGERLINGVPVGTSFVNAISGYIQQDDLFLGALTVKEHLMFQALVRMDRNLSTNDRELRVLDVIADCGLQKCMNARIGIPGIRKGISGGERKRLSFAAEMVTDPAILFCDEPTSGLDYYTAQKIVLLLKKMATAGKTIICTIHQPSSDIFSIFDNILLMAEGRTAFHGTRHEALEFFAEQGMVCPSTHNPADFFLENLSVMSLGEEFVSQKDRREIVEAICNHYDDTRKAGLIMTTQSTISNWKKSYEFQTLEKRIMEQESKSIHYKASSWTQLKALQTRSWLTNWRNITLVGVRFSQLLAVAILFCLIYYRQKMSKTGIHNINGALFLFIVHMTFSSIFGVINTFCDELPLFLREQSNGLYRTTFYFLSKTIADTPIHFLFPFVFALIVYFAIGFLEDIYHFTWCVVILTLVVHVSCSFGYLISCASGNVQTALTFIPPLTTPILIFGGVFVNSKGVPIYLSWLQYISWIFYATESMLINQWEDNPEFNAKCNSTMPLSSCGFKSTKAILDQYDFAYDRETFNRDILCLVTLTVILRVLAYIALQIKVYHMTRFQ